jgi:hypothetical protein
MESKEEKEKETSRSAIHCKKAPFRILVKATGRRILVKATQFEKHSSPSSVTDDGMSIILVKE